MQKVFSRGCLLKIQPLNLTVMYSACRTVKEVREVRLHARNEILVNFLLGGGCSFLPGSQAKCSNLPLPFSFELNALLLCVVSFALMLNLSASAQEASHIIKNNIVGPRAKASLVPRSLMLKCVAAETPPKL